METLKTIETRRSVRAFLDKEVPDDLINLILKAGMSAPTGMDRRPWEFYVVKTEENKNKIKDIMTFGKYNSPVIIITCVKESKTVPTMHDLAYCDLSAATENILLAATDLSLGSVWCAIYPNKNKSKEIRKALKLPLGVTPFSAIYIGYIDEEKDKGKIKNKFDENRIHQI